MKIYIVFGKANDYNQPDRAFESLFWEKPTNKDLIDFNLTVEDMYDEPRSSGYWVEVLQSPDHYETK